MISNQKLLQDFHNFCFISYQKPESGKFQYTKWTFSSLFSIWFRLFNAGDKVFIYCLSFLAQTSLYFNLAHTGWEGDQGVTDQTRQSQGVRKKWCSHAYHQQVWTPKALLLQAHLHCSPWCSPLHTRSPPWRCCPWRPESWSDWMQEEAWTHWKASC